MLAGAEPLLVNGNRGTAARGEIWVQLLKLATWDHAVAKVDFLKNAGKMIA